MATSIGPIVQQSDVVWVRRIVGYLADGSVFRNNVSSHFWILKHTIFSIKLYVSTFGVSGGGQDCR